MWVTAATYKHETIYFTYPMCLMYKFYSKMAVLVFFNLDFVSKKVCLYWDSNQHPSSSCLLSWAVGITFLSGICIPLVNQPIGTQYSGDLTSLLLMATSKDQSLCIYKVGMQMLHLLLCTNWTTNSLKLSFIARQIKMKHELCDPQLKLWNAREVLIRSPQTFSSFVTL